MNPVIRSLAAMSVLVFCVVVPARAADFSFRGALPGPDAVQFFDFTIAAPSDVTLRSYSYAGGTNSAGEVIPAGGFDPILSVFDGSGALIDSNDDGIGVPADPATGSSFDVLLVINGLAPGDYTVAISQFANFPAGANLSDGFEGSGQAGFIDVNDATRTGNWAFDILGVDSASNAGTSGGGDPVAVPTLGFWFLMALAAMMLIVVLSRRQSLQTR